MTDQTNEKQTEEISPKEKLETLTDALMGAGIFMIIIAILSYILGLLQDPIYILISTVGNILIKAFGESVAVPLLLAIILFIAAGIAKVGTFLKDEEEQELYESLVYLFWIIDLIAFFLSGIGYTLSLVSAAVVVGVGFIFFIAPLISMGILKGLQFLLSRFS
jgi:hypothetical protein